MENNKEREATNTEFNETKKLVEAVLERLTFHAFEEVLIWSNAHASRALTRCLKKTLDEFENGELILTSSYPKLKHFSVDNVVKGLMTTIDQAQERQDNLNNEIEELTSQLAKHQAAPEGFVLVPKVITDEWMAVYVEPEVSKYCKEFEGLPFAVTEKDLPMIQEDFRRPIKAAHSRLMKVIEAQEQSHE